VGVFGNNLLGPTQSCTGSSRDCTYRAPAETLWLQILTDGYIKEVPLWFPGARLNYAENLLWRNDDSIALTATGETGRTTTCTWRQLREMVRGMAAAMRNNGLQIGDRVAGKSYATDNCCL